LGTGKLGFSYARITALLIASQRLWIGTGNGVIISVPLSEGSFGRSNPFNSQKTPGTVVRCSNEDGRNIPYCSMPQAQLSFHGHRDAVKFFVAVSGGGNDAAVETSLEREMDVEGLSDSILVLSGGEGYIDFRVGEPDESAMTLKSISDPNEPSEQAHLIIWQNPKPPISNQTKL